MLRNSSLVFVFYLKEYFSTKKEEPEVILYLETDLKNLGWFPIEHHLRRLFYDTLSSLD